MFSDELAAEGDDYAIPMFERGLQIIEQTLPSDDLKLAPVFDLYSAVLSKADRTAEADETNRVPGPSVPSMPNRIHQSRIPAARCAHSRNPPCARMHSLSVL